MTKPKLSVEEMIERINALEEEFFLTIHGLNNDYNASKEASRLKMLILEELELV